MLVRRGPDRSPPCPHSQCIFKEIMIHLFYERRKEAVGDLRTRILHACERRRHGARKAFFIFYFFLFFYVGFSHVEAGLCGLVRASNMTCFTSADSALIIRQRLLGAQTCAARPPPHLLSQIFFFSAFSAFSACLLRAKRAQRVPPLLVY